MPAVNGNTADAGEVENVFANSDSELENLQWTINVNWSELQNLENACFDVIC